MQRPTRPTILYASTCPFCAFTARVLAAIDRTEALAFLPLEDDRIFDLLPTLHPNHRFNTWWVVEPDGTALSYGAGGIAVLEHVPATRLVGRTLRALHLRRPLTLLGKVVARYRRRLGSIVPAVDPPRRFP